MLKFIPLHQRWSAFDHHCLLTTQSVVSSVKLQKQQDSAAVINV